MRSTVTRSALAICSGVFFLSGCDAAPSQVGQSTHAILSGGTTSLSGYGAADGTASDGTRLEIGPSREIDKQVPKTGVNLTRIPVDHAPTPAANAIAGANPGATGFNGITHRDQRRAGTGAYTNTQYSVEPPDQALCVGNGFVVESINDALAIYDGSGTRLRGPVPLNQFFNVRPEIDRATGLSGDFISDPKCLYDGDTNRFFLTVLQEDIDPKTGNATGRTHVFIAVTQGGDPTASWSLFSLDTTDDGLYGTPAHPSCPCLGDQPLIGADKNGFYVTTNEFGLAGGFNGAQVYAMSKAALVAGTLPPVTHFDNLALAEGTAYSVQPATVPPGGSFESGANGTEYFMSALEFTGGLDNRIAVWALTNTRSLATGKPAVSLNKVIVNSEVYGQPASSQQAPGPTPLGSDYIPNLFGGPNNQEKLEFVDSGDDRMNQVVFAAGRLWAGLTTVVKTPNGPGRAGIAWFAVSPSVAGGKLSAAIANQGYISVNGESVFYPSIGVNNSGVGAVTFTLSGPDYHPSAGYAPIDGSGVGDVHIAAAGVAPEDGFTGYTFFGGGRVSRWGDYSAATVGEDGSIWMSVEYIPNAPRTLLANWGTFVTHLAR